MQTKFIICLLAFAGMTALGQVNPQSPLSNIETGSPAQTEPMTTGLRVYTCGNSFHAWFVPNVLADMAQKAGIKGHVIVGVSKIGGSRAIQHWDVPDDKNEAKAALIAGKVDVLTLACMLHPDDGIEKFTRLAYEHNPEVRVTIQEFWIPGDLFEWPLPKGKSVLDFDAATADSLKALHAPYFKEMDDYVAALNTTLGKQVLFVVPAGQAVLALRTKIIANEIPAFAKQSDLFKDAIGHPQPPLEALVSYCNFAVIYHRSPIGLPIPDCMAQAKNPKWDDSLNRLLQQIAWEAVTHEPLSGLPQSAPLSP
ncbi:MAG TPA: hypothetical protein VGC39_05200 [Candidatus Methylacidiphilales bacterium]